jgi:YHS domain-containing protein
MQQLKLLVLSFVMVLFAAGTMLITDSTAQAQPQTTCPVMGGKINNNIYVDYQGKRIYFCCKGCDTEFNKDPGKYLKKLEEQGVTPEAIPESKAKTGK